MKGENYESLKRPAKGTEWNCGPARTETLTQREVVSKLGGKNNLHFRVKVRFLSFKTSEKLTRHKAETWRSGV